MAYKIEMTEQEYDDLGYIADRYTYAQVLYDGMDYDEETGIAEIPEHVAWEFSEAVEDEDGFMPLLGGDLLRKVVDFWQEIV